MQFEITNWYVLYVFMIIVLMKRNWVCVAWVYILVFDVIQFVLFFQLNVVSLMKLWLISSLWGLFFICFNWPTKFFLFRCRNLFGLLRNGVNLLVTFRKEFSLNLYCCMLDFFLTAKSGNQSYRHRRGSN